MQKYHKKMACFVFAFYDRGHGPKMLLLIHYKFCKYIGNDIGFKKCS